jgi:hypothetical protein
MRHVMLKHSSLNVASMAMKTWFRAVVFVFKDLADRKDLFGVLAWNLYAYLGSSRCV